MLKTLRYFLLFAFVFHSQAQVSFEDAVHINPDGQLGANETLHNIKFEDLNNDGNLDLLIIAPSSVEVLMGDGSGIFAHASDFELPFSANSTELNIVDFNNDGYKDIFMYTNSDLVVPFVWRANNGDGTFGSEQNIIQENVSFDFIIMSLPDIDLDGDQDIVFIIEMGQVFIHINLGDGNFVTASFCNFLLDLPWDFHVDQDASNPKNYGHFSNSINQMAFIGGDCPIEKQEAVVNSESTIIKTILEDINGDGHKDFFYSTASGYFCANGNGFGFDTPKAVTGLNSLFLFKFIDDFNGDGSKDIYISNQKDAVFINVGDNHFIKRTCYNPYQGVLSYEDIDNDNHLEAIANKPLDGQQALFALHIEELEPDIYFEYGGCGILDLYNLSFPLHNISSVTWDFGDGTTSNELQPRNKFYEDSGDYIVELEMCTDVGCKQYSTTVNAQYGISIDVPTQADVGEPLNFSALSSDNISVSWVFSDGETSTESSLTRSFEQAGIYSVELYLTDPDVLGCTDVINKEIWVGIACNIESLENVWITNIAPNEIIVNTRGDTTFEEVLIFNAAGKLCAHKKANPSERLRFTNLQAGCYFAHFKSKGEETTIARKVIVH